VPSFALHGLGVSGGIAIGRAQLVSHATLEVAHYTIPSGRVESEIARLDHASDGSARRARGPARRDDGGDAPAEFGAFLDVHAMILADPTLSETPKRIIAEHHCNAEWALTVQMNVLVEQFEDIEDAYLRERKADVVQVVERVPEAAASASRGPLAPAGAEHHTILGRARPFACGRDPVQDAPLRRLHHGSRAA
jgi:phosphotransferase system enzyme I (PtsI)